MYLYNILEFRESDVLPGKTEVKHGKFVEYIYPAKGGGGGLGAKYLLPR